MTATPSQMKILITFMDEHPDVAKGYIPRSAHGKMELNKSWECLAARLNADGLPTKSIKAWRKVWVDFKHRAKKKVSQNLQSLKKTGGGPYEEVAISEMEQKVIEITSLRAAVTGSSANCYGAAESVNISPQQEVELETMYLTEEDVCHDRTEFTSVEPQRSPTPTENSVPSTSTKKSPIRKAKKRSRDENSDPVTILQQQISNDKDFQNSLLKILTERNQQQQVFQEKVTSLLERAVNVLERI